MDPLPSNLDHIDPRAPTTSSEAWLDLTPASCADLALTAAVHRVGVLSFFARPYDVGREEWASFELFFHPDLSRVFLLTCCGRRSVSARSPWSLKKGTRSHMSGWVFVLKS